jgi:hypothetical protein
MKWAGDLAQDPIVVRETRTVPSATPSSFKFSVATLTFVILAAVCPIWAQEAEPIAVGDVQITGQPEDWTHHHVVFSNPGTEDEAIRRGTHEEWLRIVNDPRYILHQLKRRQPAQGPAHDAVAMRLSRFAESDAEPVREARSASNLSIPVRPRSPIPTPIRRRPFINPSMKADWSQPMLTGSVQTNTYPAKYSFAPIGTPSCTSDYVVYPTGSTGSGTSATIIAYHNLYKTPTCSGTVPSVYWAYNTGTGTAVTTSPVLSLDGTMVAFVQSTSTSASLVVLKFASSTTQTVGAPGIPTTSTNITTCTAPCMKVATISSTVPDTYSSPFYDYTNDVLYVGDDASHLYKFTGVFKGTTNPAPTQTTLNTTATVDIFSPVYGSVSGCVFVGGGGDFAYSVNSGIPGKVCTSTTFSLYGASEILGNGSNDGLFDAPLLDVTAQTLYAFITASSGAPGTCFSGANCIDEFSTSTIVQGGSTAVPVASASLGNGGAGYLLAAGAFDNVYLTSSNGASPSGNIYSMGNTSASGSGTLYRVPISNNLLGTTVTIGIVNQTKNAWPSPVTEYCNGACASNGTSTTSGTDRIFFSVFDGNISGTTCFNQDQNVGYGCVFTFNVNTPLAANTIPAPPNVSSLVISGVPGNGCWTTGGIIIDNAATGGGSQVYFVNLNGNSIPVPPSACSTSSANTIQAVQASQSALQ